MLLGTLIPLVFFLLCIFGSYFVANSICQRCWKEKIPQSKLVAFTAMFVGIFFAIASLMLWASSLVFTR